MTVTERESNASDAAKMRTTNGGRRFSGRYKRLQCRQAVIAWSMAVLFAGLFVAGVIIGGGESHHSREQPNPFG